jgi:hypothetical protein
VTNINFIDSQLKNEVETLSDRLRESANDAQETVDITHRFIKSGLDTVQIRPHASVSDIEKIKTEILRIIKQRNQAVIGRLEKYYNQRDAAQKLLEKLEEKRFYAHKKNLETDLEALTVFFDELEQASEKIKAAGKEKLFDIKRQLREMEKKKLYKNMRKRF